MARIAATDIITLNKSLEAEIQHLSDDDIMQNIRDQFDSINAFTESMTLTDGSATRGMIIVGPPGVGKSDGVGKVLEECALADAMGDRINRYSVIKGTISPVMLFATLQQNRAHGCVTVFDDVPLYEGEEMMEVLKAATDTTERRVISWAKDSRVLREMGLDTEFEYNGGVIIITNIASTMLKGKIAKHVHALESRCAVVDLGMPTMREKFLRIEQVLRDSTGGLCNIKGMTPEKMQETIQFMKDHQYKLNEVSLRTATLIAQLRSRFPLNWKKMAISGYCKK